MSKQTKIQPPTIFIFTWNTDGLNICKTGVGSSNLIKKYEKIQTDATGGFKCALPNFMEAFRNLVKESMKNSGFGDKYPDILVFATQGEPKSNKEFKDFLYTRLADFGYNNLIFDELDGVHEPGKRINGKGSSTGSIRQSVFVLKEFSKKIEVWREKFNLLGLLKNNNDTAGVKTSSCQDETHSAGAIATYVKIRNYDLMAFVNVHLPDIANKEGRLLERSQILKQNKECLKKIVDELVRVNSDTEFFDLKYIFIMGDLNYEINLQVGSQSQRKYESSYDYIAKNNNLSISEIAKNLYKFDELNIQMEEASKLDEETREKIGVLPIMHEGINVKVNKRSEGWAITNFIKSFVTNQDDNGYPALIEIDSQRGPGPKFLPTWKMQSIDINKKKEDRYKKRESNCVNVSEQRQYCYDSQISNASWRDRILFLNKAGGAKIACLYYDMFDQENITYSDHAAVVGLYTLLLDKKDEEAMLELDVISSIRPYEIRLGKLQEELENLEKKQRDMRRKGLGEEYEKKRDEIIREIKRNQNEIQKYGTKLPKESSGAYYREYGSRFGSNNPVTQKKINRPEYSTKVLETPEYDPDWTQSKAEIATWAEEEKQKKLEEQAKIDKKYREIQKKTEERLRLAREKEAANERLAELERLNAKYPVIPLQRSQSESQTTSWWDYLGG